MSKEKKNRAEEVASDEQRSAEESESGASEGAQPTESIETEEQSDIGPDAEISIETSEDETVDLEAAVIDLKDQLLRKQADFENFRKRLIREREDAIRFANSGLLLDLVEVIDNFERATKSSEDSKDFESFHQGIELIEKQFTSMLESKYGLKRFESKDEDFDPERHQAIAVEEVSDIDHQMVLEDFQKGYMLHDRVLRHAKVKVAMPAAKNDEDGSADRQASDEIPDGISDEVDGIAEE